MPPVQNGAAVERVMIARAGRGGRFTPCRRANSLMHARRTAGGSNATNASAPFARHSPSFSPPFPTVARRDILAALMGTVDARDCLDAWHRHVLPSLEANPRPTSGRQDVTFVAYWFWNDDRFVTRRHAILAPILMTRLHCGNIPGVLIANRTDAALEAFCERHSVRLVVEPSLTRGVQQLNTDYIRNLHRRFQTPYCLTIQDDGFPLRPGLDAFVGPYDYIGAPWDMSHDDWICKTLLFRSHDVGNGGFSLRSHAICERAAWYFERKYKLLPYCFLHVDDFFFCRVLPTWEQKYRQAFRFAPAEAAARFSVERYWDTYTAAGSRTFGFHSAPAFQRLLNEGLVADVDAPTASSASGN